MFPEKQGHSQLSDQSEAKFKLGTTGVFIADRVNLIKAKLKKELPFVVCQTTKPLFTLKAVGNEKTDESNFQIGHMIESEGIPN